MSRLSVKGFSVPLRVPRGGRRREEAQWEADSRKKRWRYGRRSRRMDRVRRVGTREMKAEGDQNRAHRRKLKATTGY